MSRGTGAREPRHIAGSFLSKGSAPMDESKNYLNTDEIEADDQLSPKPLEGKDPPRRVRKSEEAIAEGSDDTERVRVPPPVANPD